MENLLVKNRVKNLSDFQRTLELILKNLSQDFKFNERSKHQQNIATRSADWIF